MYKNAHAAIRANPDAQPKKPKKAGKPKRYQFVLEMKNLKLEKYSCFLKISNTILKLLIAENWISSRNEDIKI